MRDTAVVFSTLMREARHEVLVTSFVAGFARELLVPLAEFAINDSTSTLGSGYAPFYADRGQHPRRPFLLTAPPGAAVTAKRLRAYWRR